jgi:glucose-1-phosphate cytidylyltransferase
MTGGRLLRVRDYLKDEDAFCMTYGDGVGDVDIAGLMAFHRSHGKQATLTAAVPPGRFGALEMNGDQVASFLEKPEGDGGTINAGFFVLSPKVLDRITDDMTIWEQEPLRTLAADGELMAFQHRGFWQPMDTLRDKQHLEEHWQTGAAPWKIWS